MTQKPYHPPHTLIDKSAEELSALEAAGEISEQTALGSKWRKALLNLGVAGGGSEMERYRRMKEQQKAEATQPKESL